MKATSLACAAGLFLGSSALANGFVVTRCDAPSGHTYYPRQLVISSDKSGWQADRIKGGSYSLIQRSEDQFDIVFADSLNRNVSSVDDGADVVVLDRSKGQLVLLAHYPGMNIETWYFRINEQGKGEVTVSQARFGEAAFVHKHGLMHATCAR